MNEEIQLHFEDVDPAEETVVHARIINGVDIDERSSDSIDGIGQQGDHGDDAANESSDQASLSDDAVMPSGERDAVESVAPSGSVQEPDDEEVTDVAGMTAGTDWRTDRRRVAMESPEWDYSVSHHAFRVRGMTDEEYSALVEDISTYGLRLPIIRWRGEIIDGVHRLLACLEAGVEPTFEDVPDDVNPKAYVKSANVVRRHLTDGETVEAAVNLSDGSKRGRRWPSGTTGDNSANLRNNPEAPLTQEEAAEQYEISLRTVAYGAKVFSSESNAAPELRQAVREDTISVSDASKVVNETPEVQRKVVELVASGESKTAAEGVRLARLESAPPCWKDADVVSPVYEKDGICILKVGAGDSLLRLKAGSADVVICAATPHGDFADSTLASVATLASDVLSNEGILILAADSGWLPRQLDRVTRRKRLEWICQVHVLFDSPISNTGEPHYIEQRIVPLLLFGKPGARLDGGDDVIVVPPQPEESMNQHQSIQHAAELVIRRFVKPGQVVCIPDLSGENSALLFAATTAGCRVIAADCHQSRISRVVKELLKLPVSPLSDDRAGK